jgi:crotonobetainyl-CoA:carnitine CoA-transferase CaiB-like acyl-CoA transferase
VEHTQEVNELMAGRFRRETTQTWLARLIDAGIPVAEIRDYAAVVADPQFESRNALLEFELPNKPGRRARVVGSGYVATPDGPALDRAPPKLGEHTDAILTEIGYSRADIAALREASVV